jgi:hypothetical protein
VSPKSQFDCSALVGSPYVKARQNGRIVSAVVIVALTSQGRREVLGIPAGALEENDAARLTSVRIALPALKDLSQTYIHICRSAGQLPEQGCTAGLIAPTELINAPRKPRVLVARQ